MESASHKQFIYAARAPDDNSEPSACLDRIFLSIAGTGSRCRDLLDQCGVWSSVYSWFPSRTLVSDWEQFMDRLSRSALFPDTLKMINSTGVHAHDEAACSRGWASRPSLGRSHGGLTTKIFLRFKAAALRLRSDSTLGFAKSCCLYYDLGMEVNLPVPCVLASDHGFGSAFSFQTIGNRIVVPVIQMRGPRKPRAAVNRALHRLRDLVERSVIMMKKPNRAASLHDKAAKRFLCFLNLTPSRLRLCPLLT